jgi:hypothetical protein
MNTPSSTVTIWESGRLVAARPVPHAESTSTRERWTAAVLLVLCAVVMTAYVAVLERDVGRGELAQAELHSRAVAEVACESSQPVAARGSCAAILNGDSVAIAHGGEPVADASPPPNDVVDTGARVSTASLQPIAGVQQ